MNIRFSLIILFALLISACEKKIDLPRNDIYPISLSADIVNVGTSHAEANDSHTRAVTIFTGTSTDKMTAGVWFSTIAGQYFHNPQGSTFLPSHTTVTYESGIPVTVYLDPEQRTKPISYPLPDNSNADATDVYCVGFYPADGWTMASDAKAATFRVEGTTDIMFAEQIKGSWGEPFGSQTYKHLLTWLKVEGRITDIDAIEQWGDIKKISVLSPFDTVKITFSQTANGTSSINYIDSDSENNEIIAKQGSFPLTVTAQNISELLCIPATSITLRVETEKVTRTVEIPFFDENGNPITNINDTIGRLIIINLYFNKFNHIDATCSLIPWNEQNVDLSGTVN